MIIKDALRNAPLSVHARKFCAHSGLAIISHSDNRDNWSSRMHIRYIDKLIYLTRHPISNVKMKAQFILACLMSFIGVAGFITLLTIGLIKNFGIVMIGLLIFFFVVAIVGLVSAVKNHKEPEHETSDVMRWYGV
jgi:hypothetical protein